MSGTILFGFHAIGSRIRHHPESIIELFADENRKDPRMQTILHWATQNPCSVRRVSSERLDGLAGSTRHQGIVARVAPVAQKQDLFQLVEERGVDLTLLILDGIQDPHNLGACLRVADAMGVQAVITPKDGSASLSSVVAKVSSGASEWMPFYPVTNLARTLDELKEMGVWTVGLDADAKLSLEQIPWAQENRALAWVLGSEERGLRRLTRERCDLLVHIPMFGQVESLNVSVAAGICLYWSQRHKSGLVL